MAYFPGNIMIIDDQFNLVYGGKPVDADSQVQYNVFVDIKSFCENSGIPLIAITDTSDIGLIKKKIDAYDNVRMLILDLDLNNDGFVNPDDDFEMIFTIISSAIEKYGYFLLLVNSAHAEAWEDIKQVLPEGINVKLINNLTYVFDKTKGDSAYDAIGKIGENYSTELIYHFESLLNSARDKAFSNFMDFEKDSWKKIFQILNREGGDIAHNDITGILLSIVKQHLIELKYLNVKDEGNLEADPNIKKLVYQTVNYSFNKNGIFDYQRIWTGNLYETNLENERRFALIITPECDIAQNKHLYYKILFGFAVDNESFPENYNHQEFSEKDPPLFAYRVGKGKTWRSKKDLSDIRDRVTSPHQYLYPLPYINAELIYLDFRDITSVKDKFINDGKWRLVLRVNEPMITDIIDKYSNLLNRKGLLPLL